MTNYLFYIVAGLSIISGCLNLRLLSIDVPKLAKLGQDVHLACNYDLNGEQLYALKWYFNGFEFYRYSPRDVSQKQVFPLSYIDVDFNRSNNGTAVLKLVKHSASGKYMCEISAEDNFRTIEAESEMRVVVANESPAITLNLDVVYALSLFIAASHLVFCA